MNLHVGDIVTGNNESWKHYSITNEESVCCILSMSSDSMLVLIIEHKYSDRIGFGYMVKNQCLKRLNISLVITKNGL